MSKYTPKQAARQKIYLKERLAKLRADGICIHCRVAPAPEGYTTCQACRDKTKKKRARLKKQGSCRTCYRKDVVPGKAECSSCLRKHVVGVMRVARENISSGICVRCQSEPAAAGRTYCSSCLDKARNNAREKRRQRKESGLCVQCGAPAIVEERPRHLNRKSSGCCEPCLFNNAANKTIGKQRGPELKSLLEKQGSKCPYTGKIINVGVDAELDHIIPIALGGTNDLENLQWIYAPINLMKHSLSEADFLRTISEILNHRKLVAVTAQLM